MAAQNSPIDTGPVQPQPPSRKPWEEPRITLERSLEAHAQNGGPGLAGLPSGIGPLTASGSACM